MASIPELSEQHRAAQGKPPPVLYHYTDAAGCVGLLSTRRPWFTHFEHLNDRLEIRHFFEVVEEWSKSRGVSNERWVSRLVDHGILALRQFSTPYVLSLSAADDSLAQWRAYGGDGAGYSLGFKGETIASITRPESRPRILGRLDVVRVVYERQEKFGLLDWFFEQAPRPKDNPITELGLAVFAAGLFAAAFKHPAFAHEREWRIVAGMHGVEALALSKSQDAINRWKSETKEILRFRAGRNGMIPYYELDESVVPLLEGLASIHLGPRLPFDEARRALDLLLATTGHDHLTLDVLPSAAPYR